MSNTDHAQILRNAWINAMRAEVLRVGPTIPEVARVGVVGMWIATYANADGTNAFPSRETLATLAGCSQETVTRAVQVLMKVGLLGRKRRPNASSVYQLLLPGREPDWATHMHLFTDTRQRRAHAAKKAKADGSDSVHGRGPDSVRSGGSGQRPRTPSETPDSVHGRPPTASTDAVRTASVAGVYQYPPISDRDQLQDHDMAGVVGHSADPAREAPNAPIDASQFTVTDGMRRWAAATFPGLDVDHSTAQFVSHYRATGATRRSWPDAWQKWIRDDAHRAASRRPASNVIALPTGQQLTGTDARVASHAALIAALEAKENQQ